MSSTKVAQNGRMHFGKVKHLADAPDLLEIQIQSFKEFFQLETTPDKRNIEGLFRYSRKIFLLPIPGTFSSWNFLTILLIRPVTPSKSVWSAD